MSRAKLLVIGANGQVGWELVRTLAPLGDTHALDRTALDLTDPVAIRSAIAAHAPDVIVNAAAYTQVDRAESEADIADRINADAPAVLAKAAADRGALLVHYSTDYVFDGNARAPYVEADRPSPATAYGRGKLRGDEAVLSSGAATYIFRVSWVYGTRGKNFLRTIQRLLAERDELRVVADQHGAPTWSRAIAEATAQAVGQWLSARRQRHAAPDAGVYNMVSPDHTTWHGFASAIAELSIEPGSDRRPRIVPITTAEYPTPARRPAWSVLDPTRLAQSFGLALPPWKVQLRQCLESAAPGGTNVIS